MLRRPVGPPRKFVNPISDPKGAFGYSEWGFTKANELFAGRIAMLVRATLAHKIMRVAYTCCSAENTLEVDGTLLCSSLQLKGCPLNLLPAAAGIVHEAAFSQAGYQHALQK